MRKQGWSAIWRRKQYVIAGAFVVIAVIATTMIYSSKQEQARRQIESQLAEEISLEEQSEVADAGEEENTAAASSVIKPKQQEKVSLEEEEKAVVVDAVEEENTAAEQSEDTAAVSANQDALHFSPENGMIWPMEGNVILNYSMDSTVYFATLDQYKYNPAVIIAGEVNNKVYSVAKGKVTSIANSEETGCTMTVDLGDGYQAVYGQLKELNFAVGDYVEAGHVLGYISEPTKYYAVEGSSLYFQLLKEGSPVDPVAYFE